MGLTCSKRPNGADEKKREDSVQKPAEMNTADVGSEPTERKASITAAKRKSSRAASVTAKDNEKNIQDVVQAIIQAMKREGHDDGSLGPIFIRLAWHSCGTYDAATKTGGSSSGATMRFPPECDDPENAGLDIARDALEPVHKQFPWLSIADLWILAGTTALKEMGGPEIEVRLGRKDHPGPISPIQPGRLPMAEAGVESGFEEGTNHIKGWSNLSQHIRNTFYRMGFNDQEIVALVCGGHVFGRTHVKNSGYAGAWVENPVEFSNEFAADLIGDEWRLVDGDNEDDKKEIPEEVRPGPGKRQYVSKPHDEHPQMMLPSDMVLAWDNKFRAHTARYAEDGDALSTDFALAWKKLIELGCEDILQ